MSGMRSLTAVVCCTLFVSLAVASVATDKVIAQVKLPEGFRMQVYTDAVPGARQMALGTNGTLFVGTRTQGKVYAVAGQPSSGVAGKVYTVGAHLNVPNGVAFRDGALYVAEIQRVQRYDNIEAHLADPPTPKVIRGNLPQDGHHGSRYIAFGPDNKLYLTIGSPCNICNEPNYGAIMRMNVDGSDSEVFARGIRNSVGIAWHPTAKELWFTDNGRDWLGDDAPPDELNHAPRAGMHFGFPFCHAGVIKDPDFGKLGECSQATPPAQALGPHVAALGLKFYTGQLFPERYRGQIFIAEHGSWNRKEPSGYCLSVVTLKDNIALSYEPFATGFNQGDHVYGRPVDVLVLDDGSMLVSDDQAGAIYRISYAESG